MSDKLPDSPTPIQVAGWLVRRGTRSTIRAANCMKRLIDENAAQAKEIAALKEHRRLLAMLAADTPQFFNPLHAMAAKQLRDDVLKERPDER